MYKDRGFIKWQPFDALNSFRESIDNLIKSKEIKDMPILSSDQIEILNYEISEAIEYQTEIMIIYYSKGYFYYSCGKIFKTDLIKREVVINNLKIKLDNIMAINKC